MRRNRRPVGSLRWLAFGMVYIPLAMVASFWLMAQLGKQGNIVMQQNIDRMHHMTPR